MDCDGVRCGILRNDGVQFGRHGVQLTGVLTEIHQRLFEFLCFREMILHPGGVGLSAVPKGVLAREWILVDGPQFRLYLRMALRSRLGSAVPLLAYDCSSF